MLLAVVSAGEGRAGFDELVRHLPGRANTVILFNVDEILASPLAVKEGWSAQQQQAFAAANWIVVPPGTMRYAGASAGTRFHATGVASRRGGTAVRAVHGQGGRLARRERGRDQRADRRRLASRYVRGSVRQAVGGILEPANRQDAGRWIDDVYSDPSRMPLSPYLVEGVGFADKLGTPIIVAVDLKHVFPVAFIRGRLGSLKTLQGQNLDLDALSTAMAGVKGMTLGITVTDRVYGKVKVDFEQAVPLTAELAKPLLLEALANHGAMIEEVQRVASRGQR